LKETVLSVTVLVLLLLTVSITAFVLPVRAVRTWTVDDDGPADFQKIKEAIDAASDGDTVFVYSGTYSEVLSIDKRISLIGQNPLTTIIDVDEKLWIAIRIRTDKVVISGFTVRDTAGLYGSGCGGIMIIGSSGCLIENCVVIDNQYGINLCGSSNNSVANNRISWNWAMGIQVMPSGSIYSNNNLIKGNWIVNNTDIPDTQIEDPQIGVGIWSYCNNNTITENVFCNNSLAMDVNTTGNAVYRNNFMNQTEVKIYPPYNVTWSKDGEGNFWIKYTGVDEDENGVGDAPYIIGTGSIDYYPLMNPWVPPVLITDLNDDGATNILDVTIVAIAYNSTPQDPNWNQTADMNKDELINILDVAKVAMEFGKTRVG